MRFDLLASQGLLVALALLFFTSGAQARDVYPDAASARPLEPGASVPSAQITAIDGTSVDVSDLMRESGALLVFYRGGW